MNDERLVSHAKRLMRHYMRPHWPAFLGAFACMALVAVTTGAVAKIIEPIIDQVFADRDSSRLIPIAAAVFGIFTIKGLATYGHAVLMSHVGRRIVAQLQTEMFGQVMRLDLASFHQTASGKLVSRFVSDTQLLNGAVSGAVAGMGKDLLTLIVLIGVMFSLDWQLASIAFLIIPAAMFPIVKLGRRMRRITRSTQNEYGKLTALLTQIFQGIRHVKAYNAEARETERARRVIWQVAKLAQKSARTRNASHPIMEMLGACAFAGIILYGGHQVIVDGRSAGSFFAFLTGVLLAYEPMKRLANLNATLQQGLTAADRVFEMIDSKPSITDKPNARVLDRVAGRIEFRDVHFSYGEEAPALHGVSLTIGAGETAALVGPSGAGKSSVLNLIPRFYDVGSGAVLIDGHDVRDVTLASLRAQIGLVSQEITLFDDTVRANILYGRPDATEAEVEQAARDALAHDFIMALPQGYDTEIGEHGVRLSGGQRQRLSIARAMLKNEPILLLDEATSALDTESERHVQEALTRLMRGRTTLMIAHRLSTVRNADIIFVMEGGRIVESGRHAALIRRGGLYARLWSMQTEAENGPVPLAAAGA